MFRQEKKKPRVVIVGAGLSAIILAIELKSRLGIRASLVERNIDFGGTWLVNEYPGCACDIPAPWYSWSKEPNSRWSALYPPQPEILAYWLNIAKRHDLYAQTRFKMNFDNAIWNETTSSYSCNLTSLSTGKTEVVEAEVVISCIGGFSTPVMKPKDIPGFENFQGVTCHSSRWKKGLDLSNKRVGVIGNGCSGVQLVPVLAEKYTTKVVNFCRTPTWIVPRKQRKFGPTTHFLLSYVPFLLVFYRLLIFLYYHVMFLIFLKPFSGLRKFIEKDIEGYMKSKTPAKYHHLLIPKYEMGCKRIVLNSGYLESLNKENVDLVYEPIVEFTKTGIRTKDGKDWPLDVIISATGFSVDGGDIGLDIIGRNGVSLQTQWISQAGAQAYRGISVSNFPNLYMILGPNVATGVTSVVYGTEIQIDMIIRLIQPLTKGIRSVEVKEEAETSYNKYLQTRLDNTVFNGSCVGWYRRKNRSGGPGKITVPYFGTGIEFYLTNRGTPRWQDYILTKDHKHE